MKVIASGSLLLGDGDVLEIAAGPGIIRFGAAADLPAPTSGELNVAVPDNNPAQLYILPSITVKIAGEPVRQRLGFMRAAAGGTLVHYTFCTP